MQKITEINMSGYLLFAGTLIFLITVYFEFDIGWVSMSGGPSDTLSFIQSNWASLERIWFWQMIGGLLTLLSYLMLFKIENGLKSLIWATLAIASLYTSISFLLTLGSYGPASAVYDTSPEIFEVARGGILSLYRNIMITPFLFILIFCIESFSTAGMIKAKLGIAALVLFVVLLGIGIATGLSVRSAGLSFFILPLVLGYSAIVHKRSSTAQTDTL
jgi:hypothetical protein